MLNRLKLLIIIFLLPVCLYAADLSFSIPDIKGKQHKLSDYKGKWVVVNYWATWCPPCMDEIPELVDFHEKYNKDQAVVLGVNYEDEITLHDLEKFMEEFFISYPILKGDTSRPTPFGRLIAMPTTYIISPEGKLVHSKIGEINKEWLEQATVLSKGRQTANKQR